MTIDQKGGRATDAYKNQTPNEKINGREEICKTEEMNTEREKIVI